MSLRLESKHLVIVGKIITTIVLLFIIFAWTFFLIAILPMILFVIYHNAKGKGKSMSGFKFAIAMTPVAVVGGLIWRLWSPDGRLTKSEKEYFRGMMDGHAEASYAEGKRQGFMMVSREEDLAPVARYYGKRS